MKCCNLPEEHTLGQQDCSPNFHDKLIMGGVTADRDCNIHVNIVRSLQWTWIQPPGLKEALKTTKDVPPLPIPGMPGKLTEIFKNFFKSRIYFDWSWQSVQMKNLSEERSVSVKITKGQRTQLWQPVGQCGWLTLSALPKVTKPGNASERKPIVMHQEKCQFILGLKSLQIVSRYYGQQSYYSLLNK